MRTGSSCFMILFCTPSEASTQLTVAIDDAKPIKFDGKYVYVWQTLYAQKNVDVVLCCFTSYHVLTVGIFQEILLE